MKRGLFYLAGMAGTLYIALLYRSTSFLMLFYLELILPFVLFLFYLPLLWSLKIQFRLSTAVTEVGKSVSISLKGRNRYWLAGGRLRVKLKVCQAAGSSQKAVWYSRIPGRAWFGGTDDRDGCFQMEGEYTPTYTGKGLIKVTGVWCLDCLGLLVLPLPKRYRQGLTENLLVLPRQIPVPVKVTRESRDYTGESDLHSAYRGGDDPAEIFQIREYQEGDRLRSIHWKLSAKEEELMVRELSLPLGCPVLFYLQMQSDGCRIRQQDWEAFLETVFSVAMSIQRENCRFFIIWYDEKIQDICRIRVEKEEDVYNMLMLLSRECICRKPVSLEEIYEKKYHELTYVTKLCLNLSLKLERNGETLYTYRRKNLEKHLQEKEIPV